MLVEISNTPRDYAWGSRTLIATLQGRRPSGSPEAEVWFGDHPGSPATVSDGSGRTLAELTGHAGRLPFLVKLLAAASPLSIQVHPTLAQAREGFAREDAAGLAREDPRRNYRDDNAKPEIIVAITETFELLSGLRPIEATLRLVDGLGDGGRVLAERLSGDDSATALRQAIAWLLSGGAQADVDAVTEAAVAASEDPRGEFAGDLAVVRRLAASFPGDPGVVVALLMNRLVLQRGEALYNPAGVLHVYLDGLGVEVMAAGDNVLRGGLTPKNVDVPEFLRVLDATPGEPALVQTTRVADGVESFDVGVADFLLLRVRPRPHEPATVRLWGPAVVLVTEGTLVIDAEDASATVTPGRAVFASAVERVTVSGEGLAYVTQPGQRAA